MARRHYIPVTADVPGVNEGLKALIRRAIRTALTVEGVDFACEVDVSVTGDEGIRQINRDMRRVDSPTDVLSFPAFDLAPGELPGAEDADPATGLVPLGDMVISLERVQAQAREYGHSNRRELSYLTVHSVLHLLGYDHLDEAQNTSREQMKMFLTRMGFGSKVVITGDVTQIDLPADKTSGLKEAVRVLKNVEGIGICELTDQDVVRHVMVQRIIQAYDDYYNKGKKR